MGDLIRSTYFHRRNYSNPTNYKDSLPTYSDSNKPSTEYSFLRTISYNINSLVKQTQTEAIPISSLDTIIGLLNATKVTFER